MEFKVTVKPKDGTAAGWLIQYFHWVSFNAPNPTINTISDWVEDDGEFTATIDLEPGENGLVCHLALSGREVEIDLDPRPTIIQPPNGVLPWKAEVPATATQVLRVRYVRVGE